MEDFRGPVECLYSRIVQIQANFTEIKDIMTMWAKNPLFVRKDNKKDTTLCVEERVERTSKRYEEMRHVAVRVHELLAENLQLFRMEGKMNEEEWPSYVKYCDGIVYKNLLHTIGVSIAYISDNMDPENNYPPLFESRLELLIPNLSFIPSLDANDENGFYKLLHNLVNDILFMSKLIPRLDTTEEQTYEEMVLSEHDIKEMKCEILLSVDKALEEAQQFCRDFERYSYLWLEDREYCMELFLNYGRILDADEIDMISNKDPAAPKPTPPTIEAFREMIDGYESLHGEIEAIQPFQVFNAFFQVDVRPFRQALINIVRKWGNMFKDHLVNNVTNSLTDLSDFIHKADQGLLQIVSDYDTLVNTMAYLMQVKDRGVTTDNMFEPMQDVSIL